MAALRDSFSLYSSTVVHVDCSPGFGGSEGGFRFVAFYSVIKNLVQEFVSRKKRRRFAKEKGGEGRKDSSTLSKQRLKVPLPVPYYYHRPILPQGLHGKQ